MKKIITIIGIMAVCLMMTINTKAHNTHYPTYTEDGITYVKNGTWTIVDGVRCEPWDVLKVETDCKTVTIPRKITVNGEEVIVSAIREKAFATCTNLDSVIICWGVYIHAKAFSECKQLEYLKYSSNVSVYSPENSLPSYVGLNIKTLETTCGVYEDSFWQGIKGSLKKLIIRDNSTYVSTRMDLCKNLKTIICYAQNPPSSTGTKSNYTYSCNGTVTFESWQWATVTLYVPRESLEKYYFDRVWGEIDNIYAIDEMENMTSSVNAVDNNIPEDDCWYSINGTKVDKPTKGVYIKNGKKYNIK